MALARRIAYNVVVNTAAKAASTIIALVSIAVMTRYLEPEGFGAYTTAMAFFAFFIAIADLGLYTYGTREISRPDLPALGATQVMSAVFSLRMISAVIVFMLALISVAFLPYSQQLKGGIVIAAIAFVFSSGYTVLNGIFQRNLVMDRVAMIEVIGKVLQLGGVICAAVFDWGFWGVMSALVLYMLFNFMGVIILSRRMIPFTFTWNLEKFGSIMRTAWPIGASAIVTFLYFRFDAILLSLLSTQYDVGLYGAAYKVIENLTFFPGMLMGLVFPLFSRTIFTDRAAFVSISEKTFLVIALLAFPLAVGGTILAPALMTVIGGDAFREAGVVLSILVWALFFIFFGSFFQSILLSCNAQRTILQILIVAAIGNIAANSILIPYYSYMATAVTSVATEGFVAIAAAVSAWRILGYRPPFGQVVRIVCASTVMAIVVILLSGAPLVVPLLSGAAVYAALVISLRVVTVRDFLSIVERG